MSNSIDPVRAALRRHSRRAYRKFDRFVGRREAGVFRVLGHFLPDTSVVRSRRFQHLLFAKALSDTARDSTKYAAIVAVVAATGSAFQSSLMTVATLLPVAALGLYAGEVADSMPKRIAIALAYGLGAATCFLVPTLFGTGVPAMFALVFLVSASSQIGGPAESSAVPLVASEQQLAGATSMMGLASSVGTAAGTAFLAPLLLKLTSARVVFYVAGFLLLAAMTRVLHIYSKRDVGAGTFAVRPRRGTNRRVLTWLFAHPSVATMVGVSVLTGVSNVIMSTLAPVYVQDILNSDPANTVFVMGPAGLAMTVSLAAVPWFVGRIGERATAAAGFGMVVASLVALGLVDHNIAVVVDPVNPLRLIGLTGFDVSENIRTAALLSVPLGLGVGLTDNSVKTYINRRVPLSYQGRTFAARNVLESSVGIIPLVAVSGLASLIGVGTVLILMPFAIYGLFLLLLFVSRRFGADTGSARAMVLATFWEEGESIDDPGEAPAKYPAAQP